MKAELPVPDDLTAQQKAALVRWVRQRQAEFGHFDWIRQPRDLRAIVDDCLAYHAARENPNGYTDWLAVCRRWLVKAQQIRERDRQAGRRSAFVDLEAPLRLVPGGKR